MNIVLIVGIIGLILGLLFGFLGVRNSFLPGTGVGDDKSFSKFVNKVLIQGFLSTLFLLIFAGCGTVWLIDFAKGYF